MRIIPKKTKVTTEFFKGLSLTDVIVSFVGVLIMAFVLVSNLPFKLYLIIGLLVILVFLMLRMDDEPVYMFLLHILRHAAYRKSYHKLSLEEEREREAEEKAWEALTPKERKEFLKEAKRQEKKQKKEELKQRKAEKRAGQTREVQLPEEPLSEELPDYKGNHSRKKVSRKEKQQKKKAAAAGKELSASETPVPEKKNRKTRAIEKKQQKQAEKERLEKEKFSEEAIAAREEARELKEREKLIRKEMKKSRFNIRDLMPFSGISGNMITYAGQYYGTVIEIPAVEFRFFSEHRQDHAIDNAFGSILRSLPMKYSANLVKIERPVLYDEYIEKEYEKLKSLETAYVNGLFTEGELQTRTEVIYDRIHYLNTICFDQKVVLPFFYLVLFDSDKNQLETQTANAVSSLQGGELNPRRLTDREIAVFLRYTNGIDFDEIGRAHV